MNIQEIYYAYNLLRNEFPFQNYLDPFGEGICYVVSQVCGLMPQRGRLLDIGCGPLDKTALFAKMGFLCSACDDFGDQWHREGENFKRICDFASLQNITLYIQNTNDNSIPFPENSFDVVVILDVIEHLHESPRSILNIAGKALKVGGICVITMPNSVNFLKRIKVLLGKSNYPDIRGFYYSDGQWRGHVREYTLSEAMDIIRWNGYDIIKAQTYHGMLHKKVHSDVSRHLFRCLTTLVPTLRDSLLVIATKNEGWLPKKYSGKDFREAINPFIGDIM